MTAPRVIVVSLRKSGTHLVERLVRALGYSVTGQVARPAGPPAVLDRSTVLRLLGMVYTDDELAAITASTDRAAVDLAVRRAQDAVLGTWRVRLGLPPGRAPSDEVTAQLTARTLTRPAARSFAHTPAGVCWFLHQLEVDRVDPDFLREWMETGSPKVVLNHRDPRDALLSMVEFLAGRSSADLAGLPEHQLYGEILKSLPDTARRLTYALRDPSFPGGDALARALWLRRHPRVCSVSFEELVGRSGGGSGEAQEAAVARLVTFLGGEADAGEIARDLFDTRSYTFSRGAIGAWREQFTARHTALFEERYGPLMEEFGYH